MLTAYINFYTGDPHGGTTAGIEGYDNPRPIHIHDAGRTQLVGRGTADIDAICVPHCNIGGELMPREEVSLSRSAQP